MSALIAWRNYMDDVTLTAANIDPNHPLTNVQRRGLGERTESSYSTLMIEAPITGTHLDIGFIAFLDSDAAASGGGAAQVFYSTVSSGGSWTPWASSTTSIPYPADEPRYGLPSHRFIIPTAPLPPSVKRLRFTGGTRLGRLWAGPSMTLPDGISAQWRMGFRDAGALNAGEGQQHVQTAGVRTRVLTIPLGGANDTKLTWGFDEGDTTTSNPMNLHALQLEAGTTAEVIAIARTTSPLWAYRTGIYGHIASPWEIEHEAGPYWRSALAINEER